MTFNAENNLPKSLRVPKQDTYPLSADAEMFVDNFVALEFTWGEAFVNSDEIDSIALGAIAIHGPVSAQILSRNPRAVIGSLLTPDGTFEQSRALFVPNVSLESFKGALRSFGDVSYQHAGRPVTFCELTQVATVFTDIELKDRLRVRQNVVDVLSNTAIGSFEADPFKEDLYVRFGIRSHRN